MRIQVTPFVPGQVNGKVHVGIVGAPADSLVLVHQRDLDISSLACKGLLVIDGAPLSHPMIHLLGRAIPTAFLTPSQAAELKQGDVLYLDAGRGWLSDEPHHDAPVEAGHAPAATSANLVTTRDGQPIALRASIGNAPAAAQAARAGVREIGSLRTEYLGADSLSPPSREFYQQQIAEVCQQAGFTSVIVRLPDHSVDKLPAWLGRIAGMDSALGLRGARLYGLEPCRSSYLAVVDALGQLSTHYDLQLMVPLITTLEEFVRLRHEIEQRLPYPMAIGAMIETPAAALMIAEFLAAADFVSLGCNDLMQCLFAADRDVPEVNHYLNPYSPAVFRLLRLIAQGAGDRVGQVQVCGLLAHAPLAVPVLLGLGYRIFSVDPLLIPALADAIRRTDATEAAHLAAAVCAAPDAQTACTLLGAPAGVAWGF